MYEYAATSDWNRQLVYSLSRSLHIEEPFQQLFEGPEYRLLQGEIFFLQTYLNFAVAVETLAFNPDQPTLQTLPRSHTVYI